MLLRVILAIDDAGVRRRLRRLLANADDVVVESIRGSQHVWERSARRSGDVIIATESMVPEPLEDSFALVKGLPEPRSVVVMCGTEDADRHARLLAAGCDMVLFSGLAEESLAQVLGAVLGKHAQLAQRIRPARPVLAEPRLSDFVSESPSMQVFMQTVRRVVRSDSSLLILGETGVGKERLAQAIHAEGPRSSGPFLAVNCGALPESLLESELFGHEEGAFTGATRSRRGAFEMAHGGTIFLDEIAELALHLQVKLLRVLQEHEIRRVGAEKAFNVDVRVMAASNRDLEQEVAAGQFRRDLFYRLSVVSLTVPPLRERVEDIPSLVESYIAYLGLRIGREVYGIGQPAVDSLCAYSWPGNVRELINVVERAMLLCDGEEITLDDLPASISGDLATSTSAGASAAAPQSEEAVPAEWLERTLPEIRAAMVQDLERSYLAAVLRQAGGRIGEAAERAGIEARSLYEKMKRYGMRKEDFRPRRPKV
ncbi:MAG: sigma-54 dependent transcriptional regulator [Phycisphaerae bacterium]